MVTFRRRQLAEYDDGVPLGFLHLPKAAGSSLIDAIVRALRPDSVVSGFDRVLFGDFLDFDGFAPEVRAQIFVDSTTIPHGRLIAGHMALSSLCAAGAVQVMMVLREPVCRLVSHYLFWRGHDDARLAPWGTWAAWVRLSRGPLAAFLATPELACQHDNLALRMLLWPHPCLPPHGFINPKHDRRLFADAERALDQLSFVDLMENRDLIANISRFLGHPLVPYRLNETGRLPDGLRGPLDRELTDESLATIAHLTRLDSRLWQLVCQRRLPGTDGTVFQQNVLMKNFARFGLFMS